MTALEVGMRVFTYGFCTVAISHGLYVAFNDLTGRKEWWRHGPFTSLSLTFLTLAVLVAVITPIMWLVGKAAIEVGL